MVPTIDLNALAPHQDVAADICIVGGGAAGLYLTRQLAQAGKNVVLLEAGPAWGAAASEADFECSMDARHYSGASSGRFFGLGGTTTHWGGLLVPHAEHDVKDDDPTAWAWRHVVSAVEARAAAVLADLGYKGGADFETWPATYNPTLVKSLLQVGIKTIASLHLPFRRKNFVVLLEANAVLRNQPQVYIGAVAKTWEGAHHSARYRIRSLVGVSRNGNQIRITADHFVVAAGALESARILLEINAGAENRALRTGAAPGCYLTDHVSVPIAEVPQGALKAAAEFFGPRFMGPWMRSLRFIALNARLAPTRSFTHFNFIDRSAGFEVARKCMQALQKRRLPDVRAVDVLRGAADVIQLGGMRFLRSRLHIPRSAQVQLQLDVEQTPVRENGIRLTDNMDKHGRRIPAVRWSISHTDEASIKAAASRFVKVWPGEAAGLPRLVPCQLEATGEKLYDAYHPVGATKMGETAEAVVDRDLKVWGTDNLYVASTGVLPSAGSANPTFSMLCLAHRLAEKLATCH